MFDAKKLTFPHLSVGFDTILGAVDARSDASIAAKFDPTTVATHRTNEPQNR